MMVKGTSVHVCLIGQFLDGNFGNALLAQQPHQRCTQCLFCLADCSVLASLLKSIVNHRQTPLFLSHIVHLLCNMFNMPKFTRYYEHVFIINAIKLFVNALFR